MSNPQLPPRETLEALFPLSKDPPSDQTFEFGLVLGGTVSAGAYTGGALDFLVQALDAWHERSGGPPHRVQLSVAGGSSGGTVCSILLGILSNRKFTHVMDSAEALSSTTPVIDNRLWNLWIDAFDFHKLVDCSDLGGSTINEETGVPIDNTQHVASLLNCKMIDDALDDIVGYARLPGDKNRDWVAKPYRTVVTVANLRGIPYKIDGIPAQGAYTGNAFIQHDDYGWFAIPNWPSEVGPPSPPTIKRPDEFWVANNPPANNGLVDIGFMAQWGAASGAMPIVLKARYLQQPAEHYIYRPRVRPVIRGTPPKIDVDIDWPVPDWEELPEVAQGKDIAFSAVDGGTFNNDPVRLVHTALAGLIGTNPRGASDANRAILMIDPLVDKPTALAPTGMSALKVGESIISAFVDQSRYQTADMELFANADIFSRFQLIPTRIVDEKQRVGEAALAGTSLFAVAGWCSRWFRVHDFLLGRANMLDYLKRDFILRGDNALFTKWSFSYRQKFAVDSMGNPITLIEEDKPGDYFLPIIPIADDLVAVTPPWPAGKLDPNTIHGPLRTRLEAVLGKFREDNKSGFGPWLASLVGIPMISSWITSNILNSFGKELQDAGLWPPRKI